MDTILFSGVGVLLVLFAMALIKKHKQFVANSVEVPGEVIDIVQTYQVNRDGEGGARSRVRQVPVVKYRYNRFYKFQSDIDIARKGVTIGSPVTVRIDPFKPKTAKLELGLANHVMLFRLMIGLGIFFIIIGAVQYEPRDFDLDHFNNWVPLAFMVFGGIYLYFKLSPLIGFLKHNPIYTENAEELDE